MKNTAWYVVIAEMLLASYVLTSLAGCTRIKQISGQHDGDDAEIDGSSHARSRQVFLRREPTSDLHSFWGNVRRFRWFRCCASKCAHLWVDSVFADR